MPYSARGRTSRALRVGPHLGSINVGGMRFGPGGPSGGIFDSRFLQSSLNAQMSGLFFGPGVGGPLQFGLNMFGMDGPMDWLQKSSIGKALGKIGGIF